MRNYHFYITFMETSLTSNGTLSEEQKLIEPVTRLPNGTSHLTKGVYTPLL